MLKNKAFSRQTRQGRIIKVYNWVDVSVFDFFFCPFWCFDLTSFFLGFQEVREHYLRDDIYCGAPYCKNGCKVSSPCLSDSHFTILVLDTNVVLNQVHILRYNLNSVYFYWVYFEFLICVRLICWRIRLLTMWWCCLWCCRRSRTRILRFITDSGLCVAIL